MSGSFSGRKEIEGGSEPPLYDEPSAVVNLPQQTSDNKLSTESEPSRLRSEKTQKEGYEPIGELSSSLIEKAKSKKKPTKTAHEKSKMKSKKGKKKKSPDASRSYDTTEDEMEDEEEEEEEEQEAKPPKKERKSKKKEVPKKKSERKSNREPEEVEEQKGQKVKRDPTWVWIATIMTLLSLVFCIYSCLVAFTALGNKIASEEFPWLDLEVMLGNE
uniref:Uncharacterized protein n=1 Tax=Meloidogyne incognita TaxID=6306 RepID=A0A914L1A9_MELIC